MYLQCIKNILQSIFRKDTVILNIFYNELNYQRIEESLTYDVSLLRNMTYGVSLLRNMTYGVSLLRNMIYDVSLLRNM